MSDPITVTQENEFQGVTIWLGGVNPITVTDDTRVRSVADAIHQPLQRATVKARLRGIADMIEAAELEERFGAVPQRYVTPQVTSMPSDAPATSSPALDTTNLP